MNSLVKLVIAAFVAIGFFTSPRGWADEVAVKTIWIRSLPKGVNIWIPGSREKDVVYADARSRPKSLSKYGDALVLTFDGDFHLKIKGQTINASHGDVYINGVPMNNETNAVIDEKANVKPGWFIRNFD